MNERILALAASHFPRDGEGNIHATPEIIGEFAELIVQQCIDAVENTNDRYRKDYFADKIRERFGVES